MSEYETDVSRWSERQGALLRRLAAGECVNDADLDWPNIAEEIETVGRSERAALSSHISNVLEQSCRSRPPPTLVQAGGRPSCAGEVEELLRDSPSLRPAVGDIVARRLPVARRLAIAALTSHREQPVLDPNLVVFGEAQVLGDWLPE